MAVDASSDPGLLEKALRRIVQEQKGWAKFVPPEAKGARPGTVGTGVPASAGEGGATIEEEDASLRTYWPAKTLTSTDGLFTLQVEPIKSLRLRSGDDATFDNPD